MSESRLIDRSPTTRRASLGVQKVARSVLRVAQLAADVPVLEHAPRLAKQQRSPCRVLGMKFVALRCALAHAYKGK